MIKSSPSVADSRVVIGRAGAPHGVGGELRIIPLTDFPERFRDMQEVYVGDELLHIDSVQLKGTPQLILMRFREYPVREQAASLTGRYLSVERAKAVPLQEGQYYTFDIIGLEVQDTKGNVLGTVTDVLQPGANDVYVVSKDGEPDQLFAAIEEVVKDIDVENKLMIVDPPEWI